MRSARRNVAAGVAALMLLGASSHAAPGGGTVEAQSASPAGPGTATVTAPPVRLGPQVQVNPPPPLRRRALFVSDSSFAGIRWTGHLGSLQGTEIDARLESCRRLIGASCRGREGYAPPTALSEVLSVPVDAYEVLVVGTGYNDDASLFPLAVSSIMGAARSRGIDQVVWITYREQVTYNLPAGASNAATFRANNAHLREQRDSGAYPDLFLADWHRYSFSRWDWVAVDGVHLTTTGGRAGAEFVSRTLAFLDERECPPGLGGPTTNNGVCADPSVAGSPW